MLLGILLTVLWAHCVHTTHCMCLVGIYTRCSTSQLHVQWYHIDSWNQLCWEYLYHGNWQTPQMKFCSVVIVIISYSLESKWLNPSICHCLCPSSYLSLSNLCLQLFTAPTSTPRRMPYWIIGYMIPPNFKTERSVRSRTENRPISWALKNWEQ